MDTTPMISKEISDFGREAREGSADKSFANYTADSGAARGLMGGGDNFNQGLSYSNPQLSAIRSKYGGDFNREMKRVSLNAMKSADEDHLRKVQVANQLANEEMAINRQKEHLKRMKKQAARAARGQLVGSVLGIVGAVGGAAAGSAAGPTGAIAGGMAGQALGQGAGTAIGGGL